MRWPAFLFALACLHAPAPAAIAQTTTHVRRVAEPPRLEEFLDGSVPPDAIAITDFIQREPGDGVPASQNTAAYLSYDDDRLYVVFICRDTEPDKVRARLTRRENFEGDDAVGIVLDTFFDRRRAYIFLVNPLGIQLDGITAEGQEDDYSFDTLWHSEGRLTPFGYIVRIEIPFKSLRFPSTGAQKWGVALARLIPRANETSFWPAITRNIAGFVQQLAPLEGLERISPGRNLQFIPYAAFAAARTPDRAGAYDTDADARTGIDAKLVLKDAFSVDVALNPDFSQVESDEPQVTINERFEVFFPERRPFFIENATYFESPIQLFFSRRVADPQFGGRITGKKSGWALGALAIDDRAAGRRAGPDGVLPGGRAGIAVLRAQRDFGEQSSVGVFVTNRDFDESSSRVASADGRIKLNANWVARGQATYSATRELDGRSWNAPAWFASIGRESRGFQYEASYLDISPDFRVPLGFVQRTDLRQVEQRASYTWRPTSGRVVGFGPEMIAWTIWDHRGRLQEWFVSPEFEVELRGQTSFGIDHREQMELFEGTEFRKRSTELSAASEWLKWLSGSVEYSWGGEVNFDPASGVAPFLGTERSAEIGVTIRPYPALRLDQTYLYSALSVRDPIAARPAARAGDSVFRNHILRTRVNYQFTKELSLRAIVDYGAVLPDTALVDLERRKDTTGDVLFTYLLNPGTALYVGYTDRYENLRERGRFRSSGRQVFVKASYLLRF